MSKNPISADEVYSAVREHYATAAQQATGCCGPSSCCGGGEPISSACLYESPDVAELPPEVTGLSMGCGDPIAIASLEPGQTVLDLGSGGGIDCFLAAKRVGPSGHVIGVDMTPEMLERARANAVKLGMTNVEFRLGEIEHLPVADEGVDVVISNCVINLSPDKPQVFREVYRVLRPGGWLAVSDIVTRGSLPDDVQRSLEAWAGCVAGALPVEEYVAAIEAAGFAEVQVAPQTFDESVIEDAAAQIGLAGPLSPPDELLVFNARVTAVKR